MGIWDGAIKGAQLKLAELSDPKRLLAEQAAQAGNFALQGEMGYGAMGSEAQGARDYLRTLASGEHSVSAEQLRQGLQQQRAMQQSMAAGGPAGSAPLAARTAAIQAGRAGTAMAGQQAMAGLQERNQAQAALAEMIMKQRALDAQIALQSRGNAITGYGAGQNAPEKKSWMEKYGPTIAGIGGLLASDRELKTDVDDGESTATRALKSMRPYAYRYKEPRHGRGRQLGVMAQDLEQAGLGHAVINTPEGKMVHAGKLAGANTAMLAALDRRLEKIERGQRRKGKR